MQSTQSSLRLCGALAALVFAAGSLRAATVIYSHNFTGGAVPLNGTAVTVGVGNWTAAAVVNADGDFSTGAGSATLPFAPENGWLYTLEARVINVSGNANWVALGFANGQNSATSVNDRFITGNVVGTAWMLARGSNSTNPNVAFLGAGNLGTGNHGLTSAADWPALNTSGGNFDLRVVLDTTGGSGNWTATWLAKTTADAGYTMVRPAADVLNEANFTSVGFAFANNQVFGSIESLSLTAVPEPATALLGGLGFLALLRRRP